MNGWINQDQQNLNTSEDFDIYKDSSNMLRYDSSSNPNFNWGTTNPAQYKWTFYKVVEN